MSEHHAPQGSQFPTNTVQSESRRPITETKTIEERLLPGLQTILYLLWNIIILQNWHR